MKKFLPYLRRRQVPLIRRKALLIRRKALLIVLAAAVVSSSAYLTPLYPVYAQGAAMGPGVVAQPGNPGNGAPGRPPMVASAPGLLKTPDAMMEKMETKMEDKMMMLKERLATRSAALKRQLSRFRDKAKAAKVETLNENLNTVNANVTSALEKNLANISAALERLKSKAEEAASAGKDVTALNSDIAEVESEWAEADEALKSQMAKDYTIAVNTESTVKTDAQSARNTLRTDLKAVHTEVMEARQALADAVKNALSSI